MRTDEGRYAKLLAELGPTELARVASQALRALWEATLEGSTYDADGEVSAIGRRAASFARHERGRYRDACESAAKARHAGLAVAPLLAACSVVSVAASRGAAGWAMAAACADFLTSIAASLETARLATVDDGQESAMADLAGAVATLDSLAQSLRSAAVDGERELRDLDAQARSVAAGLAGRFEEADQEAKAKLGGFDPLPTQLRELLGALGGPQRSQ